MKKTPRILLIMIILISACFAALFLTTAISSPGFETEAKQKNECTNGVCEIQYKTPDQKQLDTISDIPKVNVEANNPPGNQVTYLGSSNSNLIANLAKGNWLLFISGIWFFGLLLAFTPCVLPLLLLIAGFLAQSSEISYKRSILLSFTYVMALALTFAILGTLASSFGIYLSSYFQNPWVVGTFSIILGLLALSLLGFYKIKLPSRLHHIAVRHNKLQSNYHFIEVAVMGVIATLITSPCIAAPLVGVLSYISQTGSLMLGAIGLFVFGLGIGTPLIVATVFNKEILPKSGTWQQLIKFLFGIVLFGMAIWISSRIIPIPWNLLLWSILFVFTAVYMISYHQNNNENSYLVLWKTLSIMVLAYGLLLFASFMFGKQYIVSPLMFNQALCSTSKLTFYNISGMNSFDNALSNAKLNDKPVLVLFEESGCVECKVFKSFILDDEIQDVLSAYVLLRVDLSEPGSPAQIVAKNYQIIGTPEIIFFDSLGRLNATRIIGRVSKEDFRSTLNRISKIKY